MLYVKRARESGHQPISPSGRTDVWVRDEMLDHGFTSIQNACTPSPQCIRAIGRQYEEHIVCRKHSLKIAVELFSREEAVTGLRPVVRAPCGVEGQRAPGGYTGMTADTSRDAGGPLPAGQLRRRESPPPRRRGPYLTHSRNRSMSNADNIASPGFHDRPTTHPPHPTCWVVKRRACRSRPRTTGALEAPGASATITRNHDYAPALSCPRDRRHEQTQRIRDRGSRSRRRHPVDSQSIIHCFS
jgi:hypothetical protein